MVFVNLLQNSYGQSERFFTYRLYSGESVDDIKFEIINHMKDEWGDYIDGFERNLDIVSGKSLNDIVSHINDLIQDYIDNDYGGLSDYDLLVEGPYTNLDNAFTFYGDYHDLLDNPDEDYEDVDFYFYGDYAIKIQNVFPFLYDVAEEFGIHISTGYAEKLAKELFG